MLNPAESLAGGLQRQSWRSNSSLVQDEAADSLLRELADITERVKAELIGRRKVLDAERASLHEEQRRHDAAMLERQWELARCEHELGVQRQAHEAGVRHAVAVADAGSAAVVLVADGTEFATTLLSLVGEARGEATSSLALLAKRAFDERDFPASGPVRILIDRDAATTHHVLDWLRRGPAAVDGVPDGLLRLVQAEARHWQLDRLDAACEERLGGVVDEALHARWLADTLIAQRDSAPICRRLGAQLWQWAASRASRRQLAITGDPSALDALIGAMGAHPSDDSLLRSGFGVCSAIGASGGREAREALRGHAPLLGRLTRHVEEIAAQPEYEVRGLELCCWPVVPGGWRCGVTCYPCGADVSRPTPAIPPQY